MRMTSFVLPVAVMASSAALAVSHGDSLYQLSMKLTDQRGQPTTLDAFRGHPVIVSMFYGSCPAACPLLVSNVKALEGSLDPETRAAVRILLVSFDPRNDTPAALGRFAEERGIDGSRWTLASASDAQVRTLAAVLGIKYRRLPDGGFNHTSTVLLLDRDGRIEGRYDGLQLTGTQAATQLARLARQGTQCRSAPVQ